MWIDNLGHEKLLEMDTIMGQREYMLYNMSA